MFYKHCARGNHPTVLCLCSQALLLRLQPCSNFISAWAPQGLQDACSGLATPVVPHRSFRGGWLSFPALGSPADPCTPPPPNKPASDLEGPPACCLRRSPHGPSRSGGLSAGVPIRPQTALWSLKPSLLTSLHPRRALIPTQTQAQSLKLKFPITGSDVTGSPELRNLRSPLCVPWGRPRLTETRGNKTRKALVRA